MRAKTKTFLLLFNAIVLLRAESTLEKAVEYRKAERFSQAERLLKKYSVPADFAGLSSSEKPEFLRGVLELAHVRALQDDVPGALRLLNWAEGRKDPYLRAIACVKYAEILLDLGEFERANAYLKNADEIICRRATEEETGAAIGQGGTTADTGAIWRDLGDDANALKAEIESEKMKKKFGATYGNYVKLRRLQNLVKHSGTPRYLKEAQKVADEIIETDPASQFAAAAGYLKGEILASRLKENSPKKEIKEVKDYLNQFVKQQPDGLYRGEALMLLGKISLEIEWNAKNAEKYYSQALAWFRKAREKRDALSLYAAMNDDLKKQSVPTQKPTTLNQWKRIVYHDEDPLKLYNTANAPIWYVDDKEKNCLFMLGFFSFINKKFIEAEKHWKNACVLDESIRHLEAAGLPNLSKRLQISCSQKFLVTDKLEQSGASSTEKLKIALIEMNFLSERIEEAKKEWIKLRSDSKVTAPTKTIALLGEADCIRMSESIDHNRAKSCYQMVLRDEKLLKTPAASRALYNLAWLTLQRGNKHRTTANQLFEECIKKNPKSKYAEASLFYLTLVNAGYDRKLAEKYAKEYFRIYPNGVYSARLKIRLKEIYNNSTKSVKKGEK